MVESHSKMGSPRGEVISQILVREVLRSLLGQTELYSGMLGALAIQYIPLVIKDQLSRVLDLLSDTYHASIIVVRLRILYTHLKLLHA